MTVGEFIGFDIVRAGTFAGMCCLQKECKLTNLHGGAQV